MKRNCLPIIALSLSNIKDMDLLMLFGNTKITQKLNYDLFVLNTAEN